MTLEKDYSDWMCERGIEEHKKEYKEINLFAEMEKFADKLTSTPELEEQEPQKQEIIKEHNYKLPIPIYCIDDKKVDYRLLLSLINISNYNKNDTEDRYIYFNKLYDNIEKVLSEVDLKTEKTLFKKIDYMEEQEIIKPLYRKRNEKVEDDLNVIYGLRINCKSKDNNNYILIEKKLLEQLCGFGMSNNEIRVYLAICSYFTFKREPYPISIKELKSITGLGDKTISSCIKVLELYRFVELTKNNTREGNSKNKLFKLNNFDEIFPF